MHNKRFIGEFVDGNTRKAIIQKPRNLKKGQRVAVYVPTDKAIKNTDTNIVIGYKNRFIERVPIEQDGDTYFVTIISPEKLDKITDKIRKLRKIKKGDVIIKCED